MVVQVKVSGDPRRPNEVQKWKPLPAAAEDQNPIAFQLMAFVFSGAAVLLKLKLLAWAGVLCVVMTVANINSADLDYKTIMTCGSFAVMGMAASYLTPTPARQS